MLVTQGKLLEQARHGTLVVSTVLWIWCGSTRGVAAEVPQAPAGTATSPAAARSLADLDIEQLANVPVVVPSMDVPVTSVAKEESTVGRSPAAVFVITPEMIRRSGVTNIPDALRMAPGMDVAQVNSNTWAVSCRGFNSAYATKLLVLIDGRTVYNPNFSGIFWNVQDVVLEDVERIEVVRGPGGTLWGANAVNGVINIITKRASDTQGAYLQAGGGSHERDMETFRYGGAIGNDLHYRVYGKHFERGPDVDPAADVNDSWRQGRFGFRADWEPDRDKANTLTVQGDHYVGGTNNSIIPTDPSLGERQTGENLLARWRHVYDEDSDWALQVYYDHYMREDDLQTEDDKTFDLDFQYRFPLGRRHSITCGGGFRNVESYYVGGDAFTTYFPAPYWTTNFTNEFIQDEIALVEDRLTFTLGCKLEQNPYVGLEYQPTARLLWTPDRKHSLWGAISRAVHTPSRDVRQLTITTPPIAPAVYPRIFGDHHVGAEDLFAYELGYRTQATDRFSYDLALFYNSYDHLTSALPGTPFPEPLPVPTRLIVPLSLINGAWAQTYGLELATNYSVSDRWRLQAQYTLFHMDLGASAPSQAESGNDPCNQIYLRSNWDLAKNLDFDLMARYVDSLAALDVPSYISMDLRMAWRPRKYWELAVVGQSLLQPDHWEFGGGTYASPTYATEVPRGVYGTLTLRR